MKQIKAKPVQFQFMLFAIASVLLLFLAACQPAAPAKPAPEPAAEPEAEAPPPEPTPAPEPTEVPPPPEPVPPPQPEPAPAPEPEPLPPPPPKPAPTEAATPTPEVDQELVELLQLSEKLRSIRYKLIEPLNVGGHIWLLRDDKIKILLWRPLELKDRENYFDVVYLNVDTKDALGVCEDAQDCLQLGKQFPNIDFDEFYRPTPWDWLATIPPEAKIYGEQQYENRDVVRIIWQDKAMLISKQYGVPIRVDTLEGPDQIIKESMQYKDFQPNAVKVSEVAWPETG